MNRSLEFQIRTHCICGALFGLDNPKITKSFTWGEVSFLRCFGCGTWCQVPVISTRVLSEWFDSDEYQGSSTSNGVAYLNYLADEDNRILEARYRYKRDFAQLLKPNSRVLEIGCATGSLLSVFRENGHQVWGIDLSARFARASQSIHGLDVMHGDFLDKSILQESFDLIIAMGTISNFADINSVLHRAKELLRPGGVLVFNFPDASSFLVKMVYRSNFWMFTPSAATFMTKQGCQIALGRAGFAKFEICSDYQRPSWGKLLHHGKLDTLMGVLEIFKLDDKLMPFPIRVPTVKLVVAHCQ